MTSLRLALLSIHSCPWATPGNRYTGGMNIYIQNLARELSRHGHHIDIFTTSHYREGHCLGMELNPGIRLIHINATDYVSISQDSLDDHVHDIAESIRMYASNSGTQYDIIHSHYWLSGLVGNFLKKSWDIPHITMFHTLAALKNSLGLGTLEPEYRIRYEKDVIDHCDLIIASTVKERNEIVERYDAAFDKLSVIPCGVDPVVFRPMDREESRRCLGITPIPTLLFVGRMDPLKGLANLLSAISMIDSQEVFQLLVIGGDSAKEPEFQRMLNMIEDLNIGFRVIPVGSVPHQDMYLYYNSADYCVIPSYYESFSLVALESMACGTPVIAMDVGEISNMTRACSRSKIIPDNYPATLASNIQNALHESQYKECDNTVSLTRQYGWAVICQKVISVYQRLKLASEKSVACIAPTGIAD